MDKDKFFYGRQLDRKGTLTKPLTPMTREYAGRIVFRSMQVMAGVLYQMFSPDELATKVSTTVYYECEQTLGALGFSREEITAYLEESVKDERVGLDGTGFDGQDILMYIFKDEFDQILDEQKG